jgi:hypothetical protein
MAKDFDKIIKENIEATIIPLMKKVLGIEPESMLEIPDDLQRTIERYPDFLKIITGKSSDVFVLHIEYQAADDDEMLERMLEYFSLLYRKYRLEIKQYILSLTVKIKNTLWNLDEN